jgi:alkanesulfonate monooxygenase SsuD/methylene tetrahydromethanopterin reductase-like flavin-dependent oxidoreductase (luciferase family)
VRVALTLDFRNPTARPWRELWEDNLWLMCQAEEMGFDTLLIQEHFFARDGYGPSVPVFLTLLAERTSSARLGSYIYILPLHNPIQLAQETAVIDQLSGGRLDVMVGAGHAPSEYRAFGLSAKTRPSRMEEGLALLKMGWTQRPFSFSGRYHDLDKVSVYPEPAQTPHPPLWVAATAPAAAARAGRHGANLAASSTDAAVYEAYLDARREAGYDDQTAQISKSWSITVTDEDPERVWTRNRDLYIERWDFYAKIREEMGDKPLTPALVDHARSDDLYRGNELIGSPDAVISELETARRLLPLTMVIHSIAAGIPVRTEAYRSLKRFGEEVLPIVKQW